MKPGGLRQAGAGTDLLDDPVANKKTTLGNFPLVVIHGDKVGVFDEEGGHWILERVESSE